VPAAAAYLRQRQVPHFDDYRKMLDTLRPEGVVVATPNALHEQVTMACVERGIPALIEKPIAHSLASAKAICAAAKDSGVPVLIGHHRRHNPLMRAAREFHPCRCHRYIGGDRRVTICAASPMPITMPPGGGSRAVGRC
jgi:predicted dehydrogenase